MKVASSRFLPGFITHSPRHELFPGSLPALAAGMQQKLKGVWELKLSYANKISPSKALWFGNSRAAKPHKTSCLGNKGDGTRCKNWPSYEDPAFFPGTLTTKAIDNHKAKLITTSQFSPMNKAATNDPDLSPDKLFPLLFLHTAGVH